MTKINSIEELDEILAGNDCGVDFFVKLRYNMRSSKSIMLDNGKYDILNEVDDSEQTLSKDELFDKNLTMIGEAIKHGCFYRY